MNKIIRSLVNEVVQLEVSGKNVLKGTVIDLGTDTMVLFNGIEYMYIPLDHIQNFKVDGNNDEDIQAPTVLPIISADENEVDLTFTRVLTQAQGKYVEIYVTGHESLHGYITSIKDNYFVFQSPVYKKMYISLSHVKWLIPYAQNELAYGSILSVQPNTETLASTFELQVEQFKEEIVVLNIGGPKSHIGKITNVEQQIAEIQTARADLSYVNLGHIKTLHVV